MTAVLRKINTGARVLVAACEACGKPANFGFGGLWACAEHRQQIEAQWVADGMRKSAEGAR